MSQESNRRGRGIYIGLLLVIFFAAIYAHQRPSLCPTPLSRLDLLHALWSGNLRIDAYHNTADRATYDGHFYSDKAPGTTVLALPGFAASAVALRTAGVGLESRRGWLASSWAACAGSVAIIMAIGAVLLFSWLSNHATPGAALVTTLGLFLGAAPLPYATMLFSHSLVVGCIAIALWAVHEGEVESAGFPSTNPRQAMEMDGTQIAERAVGKARMGLTRFARRNRWNLLAGFVCGWALSSEYTAGIVVSALFLLVVSRGWRRAIPFCFAAVPPLSLVPLYSWLCFGNPFILPYRLNESFPAMREGLYAIKWPDPETAYNLLLTPTRGLLFWTPFLLMSGIGYWRLAQTNHRLFWLTYAVPLLQIVVISGRVWDWEAGPTLGPRYLAPMLPLLALPCALGVQQFPRIGTLLAAYSIVVTTLATLTNACPPASYYNPLTELHIPLLLKGELSPNLGMLLDLPPYASVALFYAVLIGGMVWLWCKLPKDGKVAGLKTREWEDAQPPIPEQRDSTAVL